MGNYKVDSPKAEEFICHDEILDTLAYAPVSYTHLTLPTIA